jgi:hypothetical protein
VRVLPPGLNTSPPLGLGRGLCGAKVEGAVETIFTIGFFPLHPASLRIVDKNHVVKVAFVIV